MGYKLLGMAVWKGGKVFVRRKYGTAMVPRSVVAGGALLLVGGAAFAARRRARRAL